MLEKIKNYVKKNLKEILLILLLICATIFVFVAEASIMSIVIFVIAYACFYCDSIVKDVKSIVKDIKENE